VPVATACAICGDPLPPPKARGVRLLYCTDPCRRAARLARQRLLGPPRKPPVLRRRCVDCGTIIAFLDETWMPTEAMCTRHLDLAHCSSHCAEVRWP
jgi:hypothetical protein